MGDLVKSRYYKDIYAKIKLAHGDKAIAVQTCMSVLAHS